MHRITADEVEVNLTYNKFKAKAIISAEAFSEIGQRLKIPLKNEDLLIASKVRSIHFRNFQSLTPKKVHRAAF